MRHCPGSTKSGGVSTTELAPVGEGRLLTVVLDVSAATALVAGEMPILGDVVNDRVVMSVKTAPPRCRSRQAVRDLAPEGEDPEQDAVAVGQGVGGAGGQVSAPLCDIPAPDGTREQRCGNGAGSGCEASLHAGPCATSGAGRGMNALRRARSALTRASASRVLSRPSLVRRW